MIPQIIGMDVPVEFLQNVPEVHKLKLLKDNETFRERGKSKEKGDDNEMQVEKDKTNRKNQKANKWLLMKVLSNEVAKKKMGN